MTDDAALLIRLGVDGAAWAREFLQRYESGNDDFLSEGNLIGWFANAIEAGRGYDNTNLFELHRAMTKPLFPTFASEDERYLALSLCGEAGELANMIKKRWRDNAWLVDEIKEELADVRMYLELLAACFGVEGEKLNELVRVKLEKVVAKHKDRIDAARASAE